MSVGLERRLETGSPEYIHWKAWGSISGGFRYRSGRWEYERRLLPNVAVHVERDRVRVSVNCVKCCLIRARPGTGALLCCVPDRGPVRYSVVYEETSASKDSLLAPHPMRLLCTSTYSTTKLHRQRPSKKGVTSIVRPSPLQLVSLWSLPSHYPDPAEWPYHHHHSSSIIIILTQHHDLCHQVPSLKGAPPLVPGGTFLGVPFTTVSVSSGCRHSCEEWRGSGRPGGCSHISVCISTILCKSRQNYRKPLSLPVL